MNIQISEINAFFFDRRLDITDEHNQGTFETILSF